MQHFAEGRCRSRGYSVLEVLIVLAILTVVVSIITTSLRGPSDRLVLDHAGASLLGAAQDARAEAMISGAPVVLAISSLEGVDLSGCGGAEPTDEILFLPDGSTVTAPICLTRGQLESKISFDWLTGLGTLSAEDVR